ncbi:XYL5_1 [Sanghuangporus vaninii]
MSSFLRVEGIKIVDGDGTEVILHGAGLGGWMNELSSQTGYPGCERQIRQELAKIVGKEKSEFFFDEYFFEEDYAKFFKSLGLDCICIAVNYRYFEDDMNLRVWIFLNHRRLPCIAWRSKYGLALRCRCSHCELLDSRRLPGLTCLAPGQFAEHYKDN